MKNKSLLLFVAMLFTISANAQWIYNYEDGKKVAQATGKLMMIDFTASWCGPCRMMESDVWPDEQVRANMDKMVMVKVDVDMDKGTAMRYNVEGIPNIVIAMPNGEKLNQEVGYQSTTIIKKMLTSYPTDLKNLYSVLLSNEKESDTLMLARGDAYLDVAKSAPKESKIRFLGFSESAYKKAVKLAQKKNDTYIKELATIRSISLNLEKNKPQKAIDAMTKEVKIADLCPEVKAEAALMLMRAHLALNNKEEAKRYLSQVKESTYAEALLNRYKEEISQLN